MLVSAVLRGDLCVYAGSTGGSASCVGLYKIIVLPEMELVIKRIRICEKSRREASLCNSVL